MAAVKLIIFFIFGAISFALADCNVNLTASFDDQWKALEALRCRYPHSTFELSVEIEPNTLPPAPEPFAHDKKLVSKIEKAPETKKIPITPKASESSKAPEMTKAPKKPTTKKPTKIQPKSKNETKNAKN